MEKKYVEVYDFMVLDTVRKGEKVWMLDKKEADICCVNNMRTSDLMKVLELIESNKGTPEESRFQFWYVNKEESQNESV